MLPDSIILALGVASWLTACHLWGTYKPATTEIETKDESK